jgi:predicted ATPase
LADCPAGSLVISEALRRHVQGLFALEPYGADALRVLGEARTASRFEALHGAIVTPFVGREEEVALLLRRWVRAKAGEGRVVHVMGEAGIGKSRLLRELSERLAGEAHRLITYVCAPHWQDSPLYPFVNQIERAAGFGHADRAEDRLDKLATLFAEPDALTLMAKLLSIPPCGRLRPIALSPRQLRERTMEVLITHALQQSQSAPTLFAFEDVQWIDPTSREVLEGLAERLRDRQALLIIIARPEFTPNWSGGSMVETLTLTRLEEAEIADLVIAAGGATLTAELRRGIALRSDGVPLFAEELTRSVLETGGTGQAQLPSSLQDLLMSRLDRSPKALDVARVCATVGQSCPHAVLAITAAQPESDWSTALGSLIASGLLIRQGSPPQATYTFKHALVQSAAYESLPKLKRAAMHGQIALALRAVEPDIETANPSTLAFHYERAGQTELAVGHCIRAGQQALSRSGLAEAETLFRRALSLAESLPDSIAQREHQLDALVALAQLLTAVRGLAVPGVGEIYSRARELCHQINRPHQLWPVLWGQWIYQTLRLDMDQGQRTVVEFERRAEQQGSAAFRVLSNRMRGLFHLILGEFDPALEAFERGLAHHDPAHRSIYATVTTQDTLVNLLAMSSLASACGGNPSRARSRLDAALDEARRVSHALTTSLALWWVWQTGWCARFDVAELLQLADRLLAQSGEHGFAYWHGIALAARGWCVAATGNTTEGIGLLIDGLNELRNTGTRLFVPMILTLLADAERLAGEPRTALEHTEEAELAIAQTQHRLIGAETLRLRGDLLNLTGDQVAAETSYHDAIALARRQRARLFELRAATSLALLWSVQGRRKKAHDLLAPVFAWFAEGPKFPDLETARPLLAELT